MEEVRTPRVFISYCWNPVENKQKVVELAKRLRNDGVEALLDDWEIDIGNDINAYIEKIVNDVTIDKVLCFCNREYALKSNDRKGGVGKESKIISEEVYSDVIQNKFLPIIMEKDSYGKAYVPTYFKSCNYIDLSDPNKFHQQYDLLLKVLFNQHLNDKPEVGKPPEHIFQKNTSILPSSYSLDNFESALLRDSRDARKLLKKFEDDFVNDVSSCEITVEAFKSVVTDNRIQHVINKMKDTRPISDISMKYADFVCNYHEFIKVGDIQRFLCKLVEMKCRKEVEYKEDWKNTNIKTGVISFILYEFFLILMHNLLKDHLFETAAKLIYDLYYIDDLKDIDKYHYDCALDFTVLDDKYSIVKEVARMNHINTCGVYEDVFKGLIDFSYIRLQEVDFLLFYITALRMTNKESKEDKHIYWEPVLYNGKRIVHPVLDRLNYLSKVNEMLPLFGVSTLDELKQKFSNLNNTNIHFAPNGFSPFIMMWHIESDNIGKQN